MDQSSASPHDSGSSPEVSAASTPRKDQVLQRQQLSFRDDKKDDSGKAGQGDASLNNDGAYVMLLLLMLLLAVGKSRLMRNAGRMLPSSKEGEREWKKENNQVLPWSLIY